MSGPMCTVSISSADFGVNAQEHGRHMGVFRVANPAAAPKIQQTQDTVKEVVGTIVAEQIDQATDRVQQLKKDAPTQVTQEKISKELEAAGAKAQGAAQNAQAAAAVVMTAVANNQVDEETIVTQIKEQTTLDTEAAVEVAGVATALVSNPTAEEQEAALVAATDADPTTSAGQDVGAAAALKMQCAAFIGDWSGDFDVAKCCEPSSLTTEMRAVCESAGAFDENIFGCICALHNKN